ncbi:MAG TPA: hypothetical protein VNT81_05220 [Vicinamibacterales bacterium]|nr:hypothetical protein [Vicinamibacterales bacterium]
MAIALIGSGCASGSGGIKPSSPVTPAVGAAAITPAALQQTRMTRILVSGATGTCTATVDDEVIVGKPGKKIGWLVEDASNGCSSGEDWRIELEFTNDWNNGKDRVVKIDRDDFKAIMVHRNTPPTGPGGGHKYKVFIVYPRWGADQRIELIDPEVDIAM